MKNETKTSNMYRRLVAMLVKAGFSDDDRHSLVHAWTQGRTESSRDLTEEECRDLVWKIENQFAFTANAQTTANAIRELAIKQKRSVVLAISQRTGIHTGTGFKEFNSFMLNRSILKKKLNEYTMEELDELIKQMHALEANFKASAKKAYSKAWHKHHGIPETSEN